MAIVRYVAGTIFLFIGSAYFAMSAPAILAAGLAQISMSVVVRMLVAGACFVFLGGFLWVRAVRLTPGDHVLSDQRGLLVALMLVTTVLIAAGLLWSMLQPEFLHGSFEGMVDAARR